MTSVERAEQLARELNLADGDAERIAAVIDAAVEELTIAHAADVEEYRAAVEQLTAELAAANDRAAKAEAECAVWRREADAAAHAGLRAQERADKAEAKADENYRAAVDATNGKDTAWRAIWGRLESHGFLSFVGGDGTGLGRVLAFIDELVARAVEPAAIRERYGALYSAVFPVVPALLRLLIAGQLMPPAQQRTATVALSQIETCK